MPPQELSQKKRVESYEDLAVYKIAFALQQSIYELSRSFPKEEAYSLTDQIRRSSRSIGANISEAWAKRSYPSHFKSKLTDSDGEQQETRHWAHTAFACRYITEEQKSDIITQCQHIGGKLGRMIANPEAWCPKK